MFKINSNTILILSHLKKNGKLKNMNGNHLMRRVNIMPKPLILLLLDWFWPLGDQH